MQYTIFVDLDGTLVKNSGQYFEPIWGTTSGLDNNIKAINDLYNSGKCQIIITTSRSEEFKKETLIQLNKLGINYHQILFGLHHGKRIVINDYSLSNPYKSCDAINISRDNTNLRELLNSVFLLEN
jgi:histidinol phosphatase-like enzyme